jgi:hypothetical protein
MAGHFYGAGDLSAFNRQSIEHVVQIYLLRVRIGIRPNVRSPKLYYLSHFRSSLPKGFP